MRKFIGYIICIVCATLMSCSTSRRVALQPHPDTLHASPDTTILPSFPAEVLYVLGARWEADTSLLQNTIAEYIEQELMRLYPEKAYPGMIAKICATTDQILVSSQHKPILFSPHKQEITFATPHGKTSHAFAVLDSLSLQEEMDILELTPDEQTTWDKLQILAHSPLPLTREAFDTLQIDSFEEEDILLTLLLWRGPRLFYRVLQSKARAEKLARYYYGDATNNGRPGDAFKHIYVNVLLRTYVGEWMTHAIMDIFWEWKSPNAPCDYFMDMHNNIIGRETRYDEFTTTYSECSATRHWLQWAENVQHFVQDSVNGDRQAWDKETPRFIVEPAASKVNANQYIYWDR